MSNEQLKEIRDKELNELRYDKLLCANTYNCPECKQTLLVIDKVQIATVNKVIDTVQEWIKDCTELTKGEMVVLKQYLSQLKEQK